MNDAAEEIAAIVREALQRRARGEPLADEAVVAAYPHLGARLAAALAKSTTPEAPTALVRGAANGASEPLEPLETINLRQTTTPGQLQIRCPTCQSSFTASADAPWSEIACSACGSRVNIDGTGSATLGAATLQTLSHFDLVERLGVGGFGTVWKARDRELDRTVALKIPRQGMLDQHDLEKFLREARAAAQLRHPNIVSVYEIGREGDQPFIVSELIRGVSLADWLTARRPALRETAELAATVADALEHAHEHGVVHRDLKPANIMMDGANQPHLMDFGLALRAGGEMTVTVDGQILGTPAYMSPEQAQGAAHEADARSDVYSLGVILFELLTGERPFRGNAPMLVHQVIHDEAPSPRKLAGHIPRDLETIVLKCLAKSPAKRYQSARAVGDELRRWLRGETIEARPAGAVERGWRWCQRNRAVSALAAAVLLSLTAGTVVSTASYLHAERLRLGERDARIAAARAMEHAETQRAVAERALRDTQRNSDYHEARLHLSNRRLHDAFRKGAEAYAATPSWEYGRLLDQVVTASRSRFVPIGRRALDWTPTWAVLLPAEGDEESQQGDQWVGAGNSRQMILAPAAGDDEGEVATWQPPSGAKIRWAVEVYHVSEADDAETTPAAEARAPSIAVLTSDGMLRLLTAPGLTEVATGAAPPRAVRITADPSGRRLLVESRRGNAQEFVVYDSATLRPVSEVATTSGAGVRTAAFSPDGRRVVLCPPVMVSTPLVWNWESNELTEINGRFQAAGFTSNDELATLKFNELGAQTAVVQLYDVTTGEPLLGGRKLKADCGHSGGGVYSIGKLPPASDDSPIGITFYSQDLLSASVLTPDLSSSVSANETESSTLLPHSAARAQFLKVDGRRGRTAVWQGGQLWVFAAPGGDVFAVDEPASNETPLALWNGSQQADTLLVGGSTSSGGQALQARLYHDDDDGAIEILEWLPGVMLEEPAKQSDRLGMTMLRAALDGQGRRLVLVWSGSETQLVGAEATHWVIQLFDLDPNALEGGPLGMPREYALEESFGTRDLKDVALSEDGERLLMMVRDAVELRDAATGRLLKRWPKIFSSVVAPRGDCFAIMPRGATSTLEAYRVSDGSLLYKSPTPGRLQRMAFTANGDELWIGWKDHRLEKVRLSDGQLLETVATAIAPTVVLPGGDRYMGFLSRSGVLGSFVLADAHNGATIEVLSASTHMLNKAFVSGDGKLVSLVKKNCMAYWQSLSPARAARILDAIAEAP